MEERVPCHVAAGSGREALPKGSPVLCQGPQSAPTSRLSAGGRLCPLAARRGTTGLLAVGEVRGPLATRLRWEGRIPQCPGRADTEPKKRTEPTHSPLPICSETEAERRRDLPGGQLQAEPEAGLEPGLQNPASLRAGCGVGRTLSRRSGVGAPGQRPEPGQGRQPFPHSILLRL